MEKIKMDIGQAADLFKIMGDRTRLSMIAMMNERECCVCDFTDCFQMSQPAVSQHLKKLRTLGLITERKEGYWTHLSLNKESPFYDMIPELIAVVPDADAHVAFLIASCSREDCC
ncbi:winged helix-turn-helix transcriptional regulator [Salinicoccus sp. ID82-1]|uniref:Winged helix-turn-helix transcriptional regulator n=1 Tax=Salinicoccus cyprini TaxID=2493691 RepID=A0A558ASN2_9STAP|nr:MULTISPECIES: metalloregulator ArsR/SmtB family transcription factor [Salinicoccus]MCG1009868.1 winged helix-turn-helix transcriptional regulator [Salinicoccus sp. ID82-1]TVT27269.1 winged helix-turn-helix transcriptional regulator [Salinicoccus cyprini]